MITAGPGTEPTRHGHVLAVQWESKRIIDVFRFDHQVYHSSHKGCAGAALNGERLHVTTECELVELTLNPFALVARRTFPYLNDVHHLAVSQDRFWVCNTGLDCIEELDANWRLLATHDLIHLAGRRMHYAALAFRQSVKKGVERLRGWRKPYEHLSHGPLLRNTRKLLMQNAFRRGERDLRFCLFRPHVLHPNHALLVDGDVWVTLWSTGEIVSLRDGTLLAGGLGRPHDGVIFDRLHYTTDCQSCRLVVHEVDAGCGRLGKKTQDVSIGNASDAGYLRGVAAVGDRVFVGLSRHRRSAGDPGGARIVALDRRSLQPVDQWTLPSECGNAVFSILDGSRHFA